MTREWFESSVLAFRRIWMQDHVRYLYVMQITVRGVEIHDAVSCDNILEQGRSNKLKSQLINRQQA